MISKITEEELIIMQTLANPIACAEILFHDFDNLGSFSPDKFGHIRLFQYPFLAYDTYFIEDEKLSKKENFQIKNGMAESYNLGGRLTGKSVIFIIVDALIALFKKTFSWGAISSLDKDHVSSIMDKILNALDYHKILKILEAKYIKSPSYKIRTKNGCLLESVNNNLAGKNPGSHWFGRHVDKNWEEEASFITEDITNKKMMSMSENGMIKRYSGMSTFSKNSPMGKIFFDIRNENKLINMPSYVNPTWNKEKQDSAEEEFGGKDTPSFKVQIEGKVIDNEESVFDMERIRDTYRRDKHGDPIPIKHFEVNKDNFFRYKEILVLFRPGNAEKVTVALDKGEGAAPTEIIVLFKVNGKYQYKINITNYKLAPDEDEEVINYVIEQLQANVVAIDATSGTGKSLCANLSKKYRGHVVPVAFNEKIKVDFEKDEQGKIKTDKHGNYIYKYEYVVDWSIQRLKHIFYSGKIECLFDRKLDVQFEGVIAGRSSSGKILYGNKTENHLLQAFQCFAIEDWINEFKQIEPTQPKKLSMGASNI